MKTATLPILVLSTASLLMLSAGEKDPSGGTPSGKTDNSGISAVRGVQLKTDIPEEVIEAPPRPLNVPNLRPKPSKFPMFLVPEGTVLLSKGKKVTSSNRFPILGAVSLVTDGDKEIGDGHFLELADGIQWVQIDLEKSNPLYAIIVWHFHGQNRVYHDVIIQVSDDPKFKSGVTTLFNNDYDNSSKLGKGTCRPYIDTRFGLLVDAKGTKGRYARLYSRGNTTNTFNHYVEVEVFGKPE
jgi:hypothetical protein